MDMDMDADDDDAEEDDAARGSAMDAAAAAAEAGTCDAPVDEVMSMKGRESRVSAAVLAPGRISGWMESHGMRVSSTATSSRKNASTSSSTLGLLVLLLLFADDDDEDEKTTELSYEPSNTVSSFEVICINCRTRRRISCAVRTASAYWLAASCFSLASAAQSA